MYHRLGSQTWEKIAVSGQLIDLFDLALKNALNFLNF